MDELQADLREMVCLAEGLRQRPNERLGEASAVERGPGHAPVPVGRPHRATDGLCRAAQVLSKYIIVDMYAKAVQGMPAEDAARWAHNEIVKAYV